MWCTLLWHACCQNGYTLIKLLESAYPFFFCGKHTCLGITITLNCICLIFLYYLYMSCTCSQIGEIVFYLLLFWSIACVVLSCSALTSRAIIIQCLKAWATIITVTWWSLHPSALSVEAPCSLLLWWCIERQHIKYWPHTHWAIVGLNIITWENVKIVCLKLTLGEKQITWGKWHIELLRSKQWAYGKNGRRLFTH